MKRASWRRKMRSALATGLAGDDVPLREGFGASARAYGEAVSVYLAFASKIRLPNHLS